MKIHYNPKEVEQFHRRLDLYRDPEEERGGTYLLGYICIAVAFLALALISYGCWCWSNSLIGG